MTTPIARSGRLVSFVVPMFAAALLEGCGAAPAAVAPQVEPVDRLTLSTVGDHVATAVVSPMNIRGGRTSLVRSAEPDGLVLRGSSWGRAVFLTIAEHRATGLLGGAPIDLTVEKEDAGLHYRGFIGSPGSDFRFSSEILRGKIGDCSYDLHRHGKSYSGLRSCGVLIENATVDVPKSLAARGPLELGSVLGIFLSVGDTSMRVPATPPVLATGLAWNRPQRTGPNFVNTKASHEHAESRSAAHQSEPSVRSGSAGKKAK